LTAYYFLLIQVIDKSFGFDTAVEEAQRAINAARVEAASVENGIGVVKLMGRYCGKFYLNLQKKKKKKNLLIYVIRVVFTSTNL